jgi:hypothetical protein
MKPKKPNEIQEASNRFFIQRHLLERGWMTYTPAADYQGVDWIAMHLATNDASNSASEPYLAGAIKVQQKGALTINKKYSRRDIWIALRHGESVILVPHDFVLGTIEGKQAQTTVSWIVNGEYSWPSPSRRLLNAIEPYIIA